MTKKKSKLILWITIISFIMSAVMFGAFVVGLTRPDEDNTDTVGTFGYSLGTVDESGKVVESKKSAIQKEMQTVSGMDIQLDEETATVTYKVVFYDENKDYISTTESLSADYDAELTPENAKFFRVIITPYQVDGEDVELSVWNMSKYTKQLEVSYNK